MCVGDVSCALRSHLVTDHLHCSRDHPNRVSFISTWEPFLNFFFSPQWWLVLVISGGNLPFPLPFPRPLTLPLRLCFSPVCLLWLGLGSPAGRSAALASEAWPRSIPGQGWASPLPGVSFARLSGADPRLPGAHPVSSGTGPLPPLPEQAPFLWLVLSLSLALCRQAPFLFLLGSPLSPLPFPCPLLLPFRPPVLPPCPSKPPSKKV